MRPLKLPAYHPKVEDGKILCIVRRRWVVLTPEEWVRQHFLNVLVHHLAYPKGMIRLEHHMKYFKSSKRSDISVLDKNGGTFMLVECKAASEALSQLVVNQVAGYNKVLDAKYLVITNGLSHFVWEKSRNQYHQVNQFPDYH